MSIRCGEMYAGAGGFRQGIEQSGGDFTTAWANELDKHAAAVYRFRYGGISEGDIRQQRDIPDLDFLTAGFPCQSFSVAGRRLGFEDTRGTLFFEVARVLADKRPRHFLLENVKNLVGHDTGETFQTILGVLADLGYRVEWQVLNSTVWVPQNRERVFIVGHLGGGCGCQVFPLREADGVHQEASGEGDVANCLDANYGKGWLDHGQRTMIADFQAARNGGKMGVRIHNDETIRSLKSDIGGTGVPIVGTVPSVVLPDSCMTLDQDGYLRLTGARPRDESGKPQLLPIGYRRFRRLTPRECERLQGWPDDWTSLGLYRSSALPKSRRSSGEYTVQPVSDTQRYRMTGNGVTADAVREVVLKMLAVGCFS